MRLKAYTDKYPRGLACPLTLRQQGEANRPQGEVLSAWHGRMGEGGAGGAGLVFCGNLLKEPVRAVRRACEAIGLPRVGEHRPSL